MKTNRSVARLSAAILLLFCTASAFSQGASASLDTTRIDEYLAEVNKAYHIPGMAFFITDADKTIFANSYGQCRALDNQFFIGSESKSFTALCIMQLVEKGAVERVEPGFQCKARISRDEVAREETAGLIDKLFSGSRKAFFAAFLEQEKLSGAELDELRAMIDSHEK